MTRDELLMALRQQLSDTQKIDWPDDSELISHFDQACDYISENLIAYKDIRFIKEIEIQGRGEQLAGFDIEVGGRDMDKLSDGEPTELPEDFVGFIGNVPVDIVGGVVYSMIRHGMTLKYWSKLPYVSSFADDAELTYPTEYELLILNLARIFALNRNEFDVTQDLNLTNVINQTLQVTRQAGLR